MRETEEERVLVVFNNSAEPRRLKLPLHDTPAQGAAGFTRFLGQATADLANAEAQIAVPSQSISIFLLD
jgi:hypothetical protein